MNIGFFGSPSFTKEIFMAIHERFRIAYAVTQPSKPVGRNQTVTPTTIFTLARQKGIPVYAPNTLRNFRLPLADIAIVVAYGKIIPINLLQEIKHGFFNVHYSLLPKYRGGSPVQFALVNGEKQTGTTIFQLTERLDDGPIAEQITLSIDSLKTSGQLINKLTNISKEPILKLLAYVEKNHANPKLSPQTDTATYARTLTKNDGFISYATLKKILANQPVFFEEYPPFIKEQVGKNNLTIKQFNHETLHNFVRGFNPWPIVWTMLPDNKRIQIFETALQNNSIRLQAVQLEGRSLSTDSKFIARLF